MSDSHPPEQTPEPATPADVQWLRDQVTYFRCQLSVNNPVAEKSGTRAIWQEQHDRYARILVSVATPTSPAPAPEPEIAKVITRVMDRMERRGDYGTTQLPNGDIAALCRAASLPGGDTEPIDRTRFERAPCYLCGYNGELYFQPDTHACAARYHASVAPVVPPSPGGAEAEYTDDQALAAAREACVQAGDSFADIWDPMSDQERHEFVVAWKAILKAGAASSVSGAATTGGEANG